MRHTGGQEGKLTVYFGCVVLGEVVWRQVHKNKHMWAERKNNIKQTKTNDNNKIQKNTNNQTNKKLKTKHTNKKHTEIEYVERRVCM